MRWESCTLRREKLPVPKGGMRPAPKARGWAKGGVAPRRIGTGRAGQIQQGLTEPRIQRRKFFVFLNTNVFKDFSSLVLSCSVCYNLLI